MLFHSDKNLYRAAGLDRLRWLEHGFGTRRSGDWPDAGRLVMVKQIHSALVVPVVDGQAQAPEGDALISNTPGILIGVRTADCVPILLADRRTRAVAAIHAGWRGTAGAIVEHTLAAMSRHFGTHPRDILAAIGPCIGACCYEVGADVAEQFREWLPELEKGVAQKLDLVEANRRQLRRAGVVNKRISAHPPCTFCRAEELHSYRRDGARAGRMIAAIGIR